MSVVVGWLAVLGAVAVSMRVAPIIERRSRAKEARWLSGDLQALGRCVHRANEERAGRCHARPVQTSTPVSWRAARPS